MHRGFRMESVPGALAVLAMAGLSFGLAADEEGAVRPGLHVRADGTLTRDGRAYRGIGVNYFDAFYRHLKDPNDTTYDAGFAALADAQIPFARLMGCGFWPVDQKLYAEDKAEFLRRFDDVVRSAEKHGVGLIPSLFWHTATVPDLVGEPVSEWGNLQSKTHAYMRDYVRDIVTRYVDSPAIWGWEFANEFNLGANLPNAAEHRPPVWPDLGTATSRSERDEWTYETIRTAFAAFADEVRKYDAYRVISTGDSLPRESGWHNWAKGTWTADSPDQFALLLGADNPDPVDIVSIHAYGGDAQRLRDARFVTAALRKPLFVGEFGAPGPRADSEAAFAELLATIEQAQVPLAAVWVYDFGNQGDFCITADNERAYQLEAISAANGRIAAQLAAEGAELRQP